MDAKLTTLYRLLFIVSVHLTCILLYILHCAAFMMVYFVWIRIFGTSYTKITYVYIGIVCLLRHLLVGSEILLRYSKKNSWKERCYDPILKYDTIQTIPICIVVVAVVAIAAAAAGLLYYCSIQLLSLFKVLVFDVHCIKSLIGIVPNVSIYVSECSYWGDSSRAIQNTTPSFFFVFTVRCWCLSSLLFSHHVPVLYKSFCIVLLLCTFLAFLVLFVCLVLSCCLFVGSSSSSFFLLLFIIIRMEGIDAMCDVM